MSRQPSDDPVVGAVGAACDSGNQLASGVPAPTGRNGYGRINYTDGPLRGHHIQLSDVRMVLTPGSGMFIKAGYTSSSGMPNPTTGTAVMFLHTHLHLCDGYLEWALVSYGSFELIPDME
jgi:hypothetical protein